MQILNEKVALITGPPDDIASVIVTSASEASKWISGQIIGVNGAMA